jgi:hypothetical protein
MQINTGTNSNNYFLDTFIACIKNKVVLIYVTKFILCLNVCDYIKFSRLCNVVHTV